MRRLGVSNRFLLSWRPLVFFEDVRYDVHPQTTEELWAQATG